MLRKLSLRQKKKKRKKWFSCKKTSNHKPEILIFVFYYSYYMYDIFLTKITAVNSLDTCAFLLDNRKV